MPQRAWMPDSGLAATGAIVVVAADHCVSLGWSHQFHHHGRWSSLALAILAILVVPGQFGHLHFRPSIPNFGPSPPATSALFVVLLASADKHGRHIALPSAAPSALFGPLGPIFSCIEHIGDSAHGR